MECLQDNVSAAILHPSSNLLAISLCVTVGRNGNTYKTAKPQDHNIQRVEITRESQKICVCIPDKCDISSHRCWPLQQVMPEPGGAVRSFSAIAGLPINTCSNK
jgi:hypothetical protein